MSELRPGMDVVTADGHKLGRLAEVYHLGVEPRPEPGTLVTDYETEAEVTGEGVLPHEIVEGEEALGYGEAGPVLEMEGFLRVDRRFAGKPELFVPFSAVHRTTRRAVELHATRDEVAHKGWEQKPRLVQLAEQASTE
ncbi:MAG: hypothetical protein HY690_18325 [Chloroflexi bacterium]|nr:hypothetical protein [Chloroflexota bacterium]